MSIQDCLLRIEQCVEKLKEIDLGYPLGANVVHAPEPGTSIGDVLVEAGLEQSAAIRDFYHYCNGVSLPDVHVGYFLKSIAKLAERRPDSDPQSIAGSFSGEVASIGSTGGGGLFVVHKKSGNILHLPPGPLHSGVYDGTSTRVTLVAYDFGLFLEALARDVTAFVDGNTSHRFIVA